MQIPKSLPKDRDLCKMEQVVLSWQSNRLADGILKQAVIET
jgi:hypothetical protein